MQVSRSSITGGGVLFPRSHHPTGDGLAANPQTHLGNVTGRSSSSRRAFAGRGRRGGRTLFITQWLRLSESGEEPNDPPRINESITEQNQNITSFGKKQKIRTRWTRDPPPPQACSPVRWRRRPAA